MIDKKDLENIRIKLNELDTAGQMFNFLKSYFDLDNCKLGSIVKPLFIKGIITGIQLINPKKK